jgi:hypothetical protein
MNRRSLLRLVGIAPVAIVGAKLGIPASPAAPAAQTVKAATSLNMLGLISRESAMEQFGISPALQREVTRQLLERSRMVNDLFLNGDAAQRTMSVVRWRQIR